MKKLITIIMIFSLFLVPLNIYAEEPVNLIVLTDHSFDIESFEAKGYGEITNIYREIFSGFSINTYEKYIDAIKAFKGVTEVFEDRIYNIPEIIPSSEEGFSFFAEQTGYLGEGAVIAVIDSSFNVNHEVFKLSEDTEVKYKKDDLSAILAEKSLQAESGYSKRTDNNGEPLVLTSDLLYKSDKIPFAFDYAHADTGVKSSVYHGNAVAGIIGGNSSSCKGVLPEAQLVLMKVGDDAGGISDSSICAAFEDALIMEVDAVNLSLGSSAGYSDGVLSGLPIGKLISALSDAGIPVSVAAGNDGILNSEGLPSYKYGMSYPCVENTDYGIISTPASATSAIAVAAADLSTGGIASFSSWGVTPDLLLKPDITSKGTQWYVATVNGYGKGGSGTSFASPDVCARTVIIKKELESRGYSGDALVDYTKKLMINTADILRQSDDVVISPRAQGAGYINEQRAARAKAVMYAVDGSNVLNLKDKLTDNFEISFKIENLTEEAVSYTPSLELITDGYSGSKINGKSVSIPHSVSFSENEITLLPGEIKTVTATVDADDSWIIKNSGVFRSGFYIEGYIKMNEEISIPFMGYYGDWFAAPIFISDKQNFGFGFATYFEKPSSEKPAQALFYFGNNYFKSRTAYRVPDSSKVAFSPNGDGVMDIASIYPGTFRNTGKVVWMIKDAEGNVQFGYRLPEHLITKSLGPYVLGAQYISWDGTTSGAVKCPDGQYTLYVTAEIDYGDGTKVHTCTRPIYLDTQAPELSDFKIVYENGKKYLELALKDNHYIQVAAISDLEGNVIGMNTDISSESCRFDITDKSGDFLVESADYALNFASEQITVVDEYIAFFDSDETLSRVTKNETVLVDGVPVSDYDGINFNENEVYAKVFIWTKNLNPLYYEFKEK